MRTIVPCVWFDTQAEEAAEFYVSVFDDSRILQARLTDGGEEVQCGWLKDRFGLSWQVVPARLFELANDPDPERAQRAVRAMLGMKKFDVAALEEAAAGG